MYEMPFGLVFRKAILWHGGRCHIFRKLKESCRDRGEMRWIFRTTSSAGSIEVEIEGGGPSLHRLPYVKTDCSGSFEVANNSLARARLKVRLGNSGAVEEFLTEGGAVLEMTGDY